MGISSKIDGEKGFPPPPTWVSRMATSLGSASVSCPPVNRAVGTVMSFTLYRGGVDWIGKEEEKRSEDRPVDMSETRIPT